MNPAVAVMKEKADKPSAWLKRVLRRQPQNTYAPAEGQCAPPKKKRRKKRRLTRPSVDRRLHPALILPSVLELNVLTSILPQPQVS
jgi:hypothetical protein